MGRERTQGIRDPFNTVILRRCEEYDAEAIRAMIEEGMNALGYRPAGSVFVKPNVVYASKGGRLGTNAHTDTTVVRSALLAIADTDGVKRVDLGENTGMRIPTRMFYRQAGYYDMIRKVKRKARARVNIFCIDEERRDQLHVGGMVHNTLRVSRKMARADSKVYLPKLKCHNVVNVTGAVKLNIGICSDDERAIRHDFMLPDKIVDLLAVGYPDFIVMDAIDVGVANEIIPTVRKLGLLIMGRNPVAVDLVASRLLGYGVKDVPYLKRAIERGYGPKRLEDVKLAGDITTMGGLATQAKRLMPYDEEFYRWQDVHREFRRLQTPLRFYWGYSRSDDRSRCEYGCLMGLKLFLSVFEMYGGAEAFRNAKPSVLVMGKVDEEIDARGNEVFLLGSCTSARVVNAKRVTRIDKCTMTTSDLNLGIGNRLGMKSPFLEPSYLLDFVRNLMVASVMKHVNLRYLQDIGHFITKDLEKRL
ncbi:MAG: DUF362 domain-containing protein [Spirochaetes bacterium]|nr:DUF362 domain-containing protein [Spirochaetota bacterium]